MGSLGYVDFRLLGSTVAWPCQGGIKGSSLFGALGLHEMFQLHVSAQVLSYYCLYKPFVPSFLLNSKIDRLLLTPKIHLSYVLLSLTQ
jgi:membrane glycosyltransferase